MRGWAIGMGFAVVAILGAACAAPGGPGVVRLSPDTYRLSRVDGGGRYADAAAMKEAVINDANAFAHGQGKVAVPVATREETTRVGHLSTIDYDFRLVAPGDPTPRATEPVPRSNAAPGAPALKTAEPPSIAKPDVVQPAGKPAASPDLYTELIRLDDLRKRGILTEDEFQTLKAKILAGK
jgi:hypothetical protein